MAIVRSPNGTLVVDGVWNLTKEEVLNPDVFATGLKFIETSQLVISGTTLQELADEMPPGGYLLATGVVGLPKMAKDGNARIALVIRNGNLYLARDSGTMLLFR